MMRIGNLKMLLAAVAAAATVTAAGCASGGGEVPAGMVVGGGSSKAVAEDFLQAANAENYARMTALFGTEKGSAVKRFGLSDVERRMIVLSALLKHSAYDLQPESSRAVKASQIRYVARLEGTRRGTVDVPIITATDGSRWFVEKLEMEQLAGG
ncbi:MAG: hypothetical protein ABFS14_06430 [Gemmatimonadota bacterium]